MNRATAPRITNNGGACMELLLMSRGASLPGPRSPIRSLPRAAPERHLLVYAAVLDGELVEEVIVLAASHGVQDQTPLGVGLAEPLEQLIALLQLPRGRIAVGKEVNGVELCRLERGPERRVEVRPAGA